MTSRIKLLTMFGFVVVFLTLSIFSGSIFLNDVHAAGTDDFVITVKTDNPGISASDQFTIPTAGIGHNYSVDWDNDGSVDETGITGNVTHTFGGGAGTYTIRISGTFPRIYFNNGGDKEKLLSVDQWGTIGWTSMNAAFRGAVNMNITASDAPDLSSVTDTQQMFWNASSLDASLNNWDVSNVVNMQIMFSGASSFNGDVSDWDVSSVTAMGSMFQNANSFNQDISSWNVSSSTDMGAMFSGASAFDQPIGNWNVGNVTLFFVMFAGTSFNQDISAWDTSSGTTMAQMFSNNSSFNQPIGSWDVGNVTSILGMFQNASSFNQPLNSWNVSGLNSLQSTFQNSGFNQPLSNWDVGNVTSMNSLFYITSFNQDISGWNVGNVTNMGNMFYEAISFNQDISSWDVSSVNNMSVMFFRAGSFNQNIGSWDVSSVTTMASMFNRATVFNQDLSSWDIASVSNLSGFLFNNIFFSDANYDKLLISWSALPSVQSGVTLFINSISYCSTAASNARANLVSTYSWTITDDGRNCPNITNLNAGLDVEDAFSSVDLESATHGESTSATQTIRLRTTSGLLLADVETDLLTDRNWSTVSAGSDTGAGEAFVHNLASAPGTAATFTLYVPKLSTQASVTICPGATNLTEVAPGCAGAIVKTPLDPDVSVQNIGGQDYFVITGLSGTGGFGSGAENASVYIDLDAQPATAPSTISTAPEVAVSTADSFYLSYIPSTTEFAASDSVDIAIPFDWSGLAVCAATGDADGAGGNDHTVAVVDTQIIRYTFTGVTTTALASGVEFCFTATTPATPGNYNIPFSDTNDGDYGPALIYVGDDNDVTLTATIPITLSLRIKEPATTADTNLCALGVLNPGSVNSCSYRIAAGTNISTGLQVFTFADNQLNTAGDAADIDDTAGGATVTAGVEEHGILVTLGTGWTVGGSFSSTTDEVMPLIETLILDAAASISDSVEANWSTITHSASVNSGTSGGAYDQLVTYRAWVDT